MRNYFKPAVFLLSLWPLIIIGYQIFYNELGPEPVDRIINHFGEWTLIFIFLTLSMTPLRKITKSLEWIKFRRMLGLFAFFYASIHMLSYTGLDYRFDFEPLIDDVLKLDNGSEVQISKCPNNHGKIKSPLCCGEDMSCNL